MINATDDKVKRLLEAWHENHVKCGGIASMVDDPNYKKHAKDGTKYTRLDYGGSGHFMVNRETEQVYSIKGYEVPNLKKPRGTVEFLTSFIKKCTAESVNYQQTYWYKLHPTE